MITVLLATYVFAIYLLLTFYYTHNMTRDYEPKYIILGWFTFVLPVLILSLIEVIRYVTGN